MTATPGPGTPAAAAAAAAAARPQPCRRSPPAPVEVSSLGETGLRGAGEGSPPGRAARDPAEGSPLEGSPLKGAGGADAAEGTGPRRARCGDPEAAPFLTWADRCPSLTSAG